MRSRIVVACVVAVSVVAVGPGVAWAGDGPGNGNGNGNGPGNGNGNGPGNGHGPYGGTTTTTAASGPAVTCSLSATGGDPGSAMTATVTAVPVGETVRIIFGGDEVAHEAAVGEAGGTTTVRIDFTVPNLDTGSYSVAAVGPTFTVECGVGDVGGAQVLGESITRPGGSSLPRTGIYVALLLAIAGALVLVGRALLAESRRRRAVARDEAARRRARV